MGSSISRLQSLDLPDPRDILDGLADAVLVVDSTARVIDANAAFCRLAGMSRDEVIGLSAPFPWWPAEDAEAMRARLGLVLSGMDPPFVEATLVNVPTGARIRVEATAAARRAAHGGTCALVSIRPVEDPARTGDRDTAARERLERLVAGLREGVLILDLSRFRITFANPAACEILGADEETVLSLAEPDRRLGTVDEEGLPIAEGQGLVARFLATGLPQAATVGLDRLGDGTRRWVEITCAEFERAGSVVAPVSALITLRDLTHLREAQDAAQASEARLKAVFDHSADAVLRLTPQGRLVVASPSVKTLLGMRTGPALGSDPADHVHPEDVPRWRRALVRMAEGHERVTVTVRMRREDGRWIFAEIAGAAVLDDAGRVAEVQQTVRDVSEHIRRERGERAQARVAAAVAAGEPAAYVLGLLSEQIARAEDLETAGIVRFDGDRGIVVGYWRTGDPPDTEPKGLPMDLTRGDTAMCKVWATGRAVRTDVAPGAGLTGQSGYPQIREGIGFPIHVDGRLWGALGAGTLTGTFPPGTMDRIEQYAALAGLAVASVRQREELIREAAMSGALAESLALHEVLADNLPNGAVAVLGPDMRYRLARGPIAERFTGGKDVIGRTPDEVYPPEQAAQATAAYRRVLAGETVSASSSRWGDRNYDISISPIRSGEEIVGIVTLIIDVTERARLEAEQAALRAIAQAAAEGAPRERVLHLIAESVGDLFGAVGAAVVRFLPGDRAEVLASAPDELPVRSLPLAPGTALETLLHAGGSVVVIDDGASEDPLVAQLSHCGAVGGAAAPILVHQRPWGALCFGTADEDRLSSEAAERLGRFAELVGTSIGNMEAWEALQLDALTDRLTGLANRRALDLRLDEEILRARRFGRPLALLMIDVDHFKEINDEHGHAAGDVVLVEIARVARRAMRGEALLARFGGEEFAVILPEATSAEAAAAAERVRDRVASSNFPHSGRVTISCGVARLTEEMTAEGLVGAADEALYAAKAAGRNVTRSATDAPAGGERGDDG